MVLIGSLFRRLAPAGNDRLPRDEDRERYMWTRMRAHLESTGIDPARCLYVCGAFHAASRVEQFGLTPIEASYDIGARTATRWLYGLIPSSHSAIEAQFGLASGSVSIAGATWTKALKRFNVKPYRLDGQKTGRTRPGRAAPAAPAAPVEAVTDRLSGFLSSPPRLDGLDETELLGWCVDIVALARRNGYLASTADAISVFETSILLAGVRNRARPTPYDFQDAAVTCIEKDVVPGRRDVRRLCEILLGGDRIGQVGYDALPPLARDIHDRLAPLGLDLDKRTVQRSLLDLAAQPHLAPCSDLLWILRYLLPDGAVRPIMGGRGLGERSIQESWDLAIGKHQRQLIELGYEGVTVEQVLEQRLRKAVWAAEATAATALTAVEDAERYLRSRRFADELGARAVDLLAAERTVDDAPDVLRRIRRLLAHYRTLAGRSGPSAGPRTLAGRSGPSAGPRATQPALPAWCEAFVTAGYAHYCTLLPTAFVDEETGVRQVAAMLGFLFSMESLALSLGCDRAQLELAVAQSHPEDPARLALLWAARVHLGTLRLDELRARYAELLGNPLVVPAIPRYLSGFVQALEPVPTLAPFVVEAMSGAFARLPDPVLLPWLPTLITTLRAEAKELVPVLVREAGRTFPGSLAALDAWTPPWSAEPAAPTPPRVETGPVAGFLADHPAACDAIASVLGCADTGWLTASPPNTSAAVNELVDRYPEAAGALAVLIAASA
jgi:hypothetical protein